MPPREHDVELFQLGGSRQDNVSISGSVSEELLADHRKKIFALKTSDNFLLFWDHNGRIGVVDEQRLDRRVEVISIDERRSEPPLIDYARSGPYPLRPHQVL